MRYRLPTNENLECRVPASHGRENRRLVDTAMRLLKQNMSEVGRAQLTPNSNYSKIQAGKPYAEHDKTEGRHVA